MIPNNPFDTSEKIVAINTIVPHRTSSCNQEHHTIVEEDRVENMEEHPKDRKGRMSITTFRRISMQISTIIHIVKENSRQTGNPEHLEDQDEEQHEYRCTVNSRLLQEKVRGGL